MAIAVRQTLAHRRSEAEWHGRQGRSGERAKCCGTVASPPSQPSIGQPRHTGPPPARQASSFPLVALSPTLSPRLSRLGNLKRLLIVKALLPFFVSRVVCRIAQSSASFLNCVRLPDLFQFSWTQSRDGCHRQRGLHEGGGRGA